MNRVLKEYQFPSRQILQLVQGDITVENVDAIVNAANAHLSHGAGVAGAIVRHGGPRIQQESDLWVREHGLVSHAEPAYTHAGDLPCRFVIHAVGPIWGEGDETSKLAAAIQSTLHCADQLGLDSIAIPALSTGNFGFPKPLAAQIIYKAINGYLDMSPGSSLMLIRLVLFDRATVHAFLNEWEQDDHFAA